MEYRNLGSTELRVSEIGFGCARIGGVFGDGKSSPSNTIRLLRDACDQGITFFDTADMYAQGESEALLGRAFARDRERIVIATKGGYCLPAQRKLIARVKPIAKPILKVLGIKRQSMPSAFSGSLSQDFSSAHLFPALDASLRRLKTDRVDLYQLHSPPPDVIRSGDVLTTLEKMKEQGKVRHFGIAADSVEDALLCLELPGISTIQTPFGLLDQEALQTLIPKARQRGIGLIARGCFGGGLLKPELTDERLRERTPKWQRILRYRSIAERQSRELLEAALQFSLAAEGVSVTLLGMHTDRHLEQCLRFLAATRLCADEVAAYSDSADNGTTEPMAVPSAAR